MGEFPSRKDQFRPGEDRVTDISIKKLGGRTSSLKQKYAAKIRWMKKRGLNNKDVMWILEQLQNPQAMDLELLDYLKEIKDDLTPKQKIAYGNLMTQVKRAIHGDKTVQNQINIQINNTVEKEKIIKRLLEEDVDEVVDV